MFRASDRYGDLNGFDVLKLVALAAMIIDHAGYFLLPDMLYLRAIGRMAFPLFFFLIGYSGVWSIKRDLVVWAALITACAVLTHQAVFPLDILVAVMVVRFAMSRMLARWEPTSRNLVNIFVLCIVWFPLFFWFEYSTTALLFAIGGYLKRKAPEAKSTSAFLCCTMGWYLFLEGIVFFAFNLLAWICLLACLALAVDLMLHFSVAPVRRDSMPDFARRALQWAARNTLPIYALHLMALMIVSRVYFPAPHAHFQWFSF
jgi:hypothetical protein